MIQEIAYGDCDPQSLEVTVITGNGKDASDVEVETIDFDVVHRSVHGSGGVIKGSQLLERVEQALLRLGNHAELGTHERTLRGVIESLIGQMKRMDEVISDQRKELAVAQVTISSLQMEVERLNESRDRILGRMPWEE